MTRQEIITFGYDVLKIQDKKHMSCNEIFVRDIIVKKPRGKKTYIISCQCDQATGEIINHVMV